MNSPSVASAPARPPVDDKGHVLVQPFTLPFSEFASSEASTINTSRLRKSPAAPDPGKVSIEDIRKAADDSMNTPRLEKAVRLYRVSVTDATMGDVPVQLVEPEEGVSESNAGRVLIYLHSGAFMTGARIDSLVGSIPFAATGRIKVISVDHRQAPEHLWPAANEDLTKVYAEVLKAYEPSGIVIFGCSSGGMLTAESIGWLLKANLPLPAALGLFSASTRGIYAGDSALVAPALGGMLAPPKPGQIASGPYFEGADAKDPMINASYSPELLAKFPPTILVTGTRSSELSAVTRSHIDLVKAGVDARAYIWDAMDHAFMGDVETPEAQEVFAIAGRFFSDMMDRAEQAV